MLRINPGLMDFEDDLAELGAIKASVSVSAGGKKKKKKTSKAKKIFKKIGKAAAVIGTGGIAAAPMLKKTKAAKAAKKAIGKVAAKAKTAIKKAVPKLGAKLKAKVTAKAKAKPAAKPKLPKIAQQVKSMSAGDCSSVDEMARLVAAKLMVSLGSPLKSANTILKKQDLQNQATYEHKKLMSDADFRRKVLTLLTQKAANGNATCEKTVRVIMASR